MSIALLLACVTAAAIAFPAVTMGAVFIQDSLRLARGAELRHNVFCERIAPGMDRLHVEQLLAEYGPFQEYEDTYGSITAVVVSFTDPDTSLDFGDTSILIRFENGGFLDAYTPVPGQDYNKPVCE